MRFGSRNSKGPYESGRTPYVFADAVGVPRSTTHLKEPIKERRGLGLLGAPNLHPELSRTTPKLLHLSTDVNPKPV